MTAANKATNQNIAINTNPCTDYDVLEDAIHVLKKNGESFGVRLYLRKQGSEEYMLKHWKVGKDYYCQWIDTTQGKDTKIGLIIVSSKPLSVHNPKNLNSLKKQVNGKIPEMELDKFLSEVGEFLANYETDFFVDDNDFKLAGETPKETHLRKIAVEMERKYFIHKDKTTKDLYIYNENKGIYEFYDIESFTGLLQREYDYKFFYEEAKKIMSTFTMQKEQNTDYIALKNCNLNLNTLMIEEHDPEVFCTFQIPYKYNPKAHSQIFEDKIKEILYDSRSEDDKLKLFFQIVGYAMTSDNKYNKIFLITGAGSNGKSTLMALVRAIFNSTVVSVSLQDFNRPFGLQPLIGAKVNILYDLPLKDIGDTGKVKAVTGEDSITIDRKFKESITTKIGAKIIGTGNSLPKNQDSSKAFFRRLIHIQLVNIFNNPDSNLARKLVEDTEGMEWLIYNSIQEFRKVKTDGWAIEPTIEESRDDYLKNSDPCLWAAKELFEIGDANDFITKDEAYNQMREFLKSEGIEAPKAREIYYRALEKIGGENIEDGWKGKKRIFIGIKEIDLLKPW